MTQHPALSTQHPPSLSTRYSVLAYAALTAILLLAAATRFLHIADQSLWIDEGITYFNITSPNLIETLARTDVHPPLYFMLLQGWNALTGGSVTAMRLFSALWGVLAVALIVPLARAFGRLNPWFAAPAVPVLAALLLMLSDPDVVLAQDVRMYTLRTVLVMWSMWGYLRWLSSPTARRASFWLLPSALALYTQYQSAYVLLVQGLHALLFLRGSLRWRSLGVLVGVGLCFAPWALLVAVPQRQNDFGIFAALPSNWQTFSELLRKYMSSQWGLTVVLLFLGLVALRPGARPRLTWRPLGGSFLLVMWIAVSLGLSFLLNLWYPVVLAPHRLLLISPAIAILIAQGLRNIRAPERWLLAGALTVFGLAVVDDYYPKEPWDRMAASATQYSRPGELALLELYRGDNPVTYYLDWNTDRTLRVESLRKWREYQPEDYPAGVLEALRQQDSVWFFHWWPDDSGFEFLAQTGHERTAWLTTDHIGNRLDVFRYDRLPPLPITSYDNGLTLRHAVIHEDILRVDLWWTSAAAPAVDYTTSAFLLDEAGALVAQYDSFPFQNRRPTTGWAPGETVYDPKPLEPRPLPPGTYQVGVQVYNPADGARSPTADGAPWAIIGEIIIDER